MRSSLLLFLSACFALVFARPSDARSVPKVEDLFGDIPTKFAEYSAVPISGSWT